jgi:hypothetical protein
VPDGSVIAMKLWYEGGANLNRTNDIMSALTDTITARIRAGGNDEFGNGKVLVNATCIYMNWRWLSFLTIVMALILLFLVILIITYAREGMTKYLWKSSSLAVLFCSVSEEI